MKINGAVVLLYNCPIIFHMQKCVDSFMLWILLEVCSERMSKIRYVSL